MRNSFTLIELIIVITVIGILASFAIPQFAVTQERARDREAISVLGLIRTAERAFRIEENAFYPAAGSLSSNVPANLILINRNLRLSLPETSSWTYTLNNTGIVTALRTGGSRIRTWRVDAAAVCENPTCTPFPGACLSAGGC